MSALISCAPVKNPRATVNDRQCGGTRLAAVGPVVQVDDGLGHRGRDGQLGVPVGGLIQLTVGHAQIVGTPARAICRISVGSR